MEKCHDTTDTTHPNSLYSLIPSIDELLRTPHFAALLETGPRAAVVRGLRTVLSRLKQEIGEGHHTQAGLRDCVEFLHLAVSAELVRGSRYSLRRVINATGVVLHTNLGRAPLSATALAHIAEVAAGYSNLELELETGERSRRDVHVEELLLRVLRPRTEDGANDRSQTKPPAAAIVVNNCAAAMFLALNTLAEGGEVIVSRGELVEIGGGFRIPEILAKSGAILREVGTTNRTRLADYESAVTSETKLILRVHQSNFSMEGFTERPALRDLIGLGQRAGVPVFDDQGTGLVSSLSGVGIRSEPTLLDSFALGSDLIAASGDKLLGGPQCGLIVGRTELVGRIRKNPLYRTYRVDKLTYAALEATLLDHDLGRESPVGRMLNAAPVEILRRCEWVAQQVDCAELSAEAVPTLSLIGGGTAPTARLQSSAVALAHAALPPQALLAALRRLTPPVVGRIIDGLVLLDLRTVEPEFDATLVSHLKQTAQISGSPIQRGKEIASVLSQEFLEEGTSP